MRISSPQFRLPALVLAAVFAIILTSGRFATLVMPSGQHGFFVGTLGLCDLSPGPADDSDPKIYLRILGRDDLYYFSDGEKRGTEHRVRLNELDKLLLDIYQTRASRSLFIIFQGGSYQDLIQIVDAFIDLPPRVRAPQHCNDLDKFREPMVFLLTEKSAHETLLVPDNCSYHYYQFLPNCPPQLPLPPELRSSR
jgi:hypothetical protein